MVEEIILPTTKKMQWPSWFDCAYSTAYNDCIKSTYIVIYMKEYLVSPQNCI